MTLDVHRGRKTKNQQQRNNRGKRAISVRATEVLLYLKNTTEEPDHIDSNKVTFSHEIYVLKCI